MRSIRAAAKENDDDAIRTHAHTLKGIAQTIGAPRLAHHARILHEAPHLPHEHIDQMEACLNDTQRSLEHERF